MGENISIPRAVITDKRLSLKARGLYGFILSLPSTWDLSVKMLTEETGMGREAIQNAVKELEFYGYMERNQIVDENGCFAGMEYVLHTAGCCL